MSPRYPKDVPSRERRVQLRNLEKAEAFLRSSLQLPGLDEAARPHIERALIHLREAEIAVQRQMRSRSVAELVADCETSDRLVRNIQQLCAEQNRGSQITP